MGPSLLRLMGAGYPPMDGQPDEKTWSRAQREPAPCDDPVTGRGGTSIRAPSACRSCRLLSARHAMWKAVFGSYVRVVRGSASPGERRRRRGDLVTSVPATWEKPIHPSSASTRCDNVKHRRLWAGLAGTATAAMAVTVGRRIPH